MGRVTAAASGPFDLSPVPPAAGMSEATIETHPLYAGVTAAQVHDVRPAGQLVRELMP